MKIGILADCFGLPIREGIAKAATLGVDGVQLYAVRGEIAPEALDAAQRKNLARYIRDTGLAISALCGDLGGGGFAFPKDNARKIARTKEIVDLALDMDCRVITTHIGVVPRDTNHPRFAIIQEALCELGEYAEKKGATFAIETGPEPSRDLLAMLKAVDSKGVGVNLDPANIVMGHDESPVESVKNLLPYVAHTHAKDGVLFKHCDMDVMYGMVEAPAGYNEWDYCREVPLGEGSVHFETYIPALRAGGYDGYLTIERECGDDPARDIALAIDFLRKQGV